MNYNELQNADPAHREEQPDSQTVAVKDALRLRIISEPWCRHVGIYSHIQGGFSIQVVVEKRRIDDSGLEEVAKNIIDHGESIESGYVIGEAFVNILIENIDDDSEQVTLGDLDE
ncbi:hypothetical protein [Haloarchaeobius amylolyticus]